MCCEHQILNVHMYMRCMKQLLLIGTKLGLCHRVLCCVVLCIVVYYSCLYWCVYYCALLCVFAPYHVLLCMLSRTMLADSLSMLCVLMFCSLLFLLIFHWNKTSFIFFLFFFFTSHVNEIKPNKISFLYFWIRCFVLIGCHRNIHFVSTVMQVDPDVHLSRFDWLLCRHSPWPRVKAFIEVLPQCAFVLDVGCGNGALYGVGLCEISL